MSLKRIILELKPTGYWKFDEYRGTTAFDFSVNVLNTPLTSVGVALGTKPGLCTDWPHGAALGTIPDGHLVSIPDLINAPFATYGAISIIALINLSSVSSGEMFIAKAGGANQDYTDWAFGLNNKRLRYSYWNGSYHTVDSIDNQVALNTRAFVAVTRNADGRTVNFYVNGVLTADSPLVAPSVPLHAAGHVPNFIELMGVDLGSTLLGLCDEVAVFVGTELNAGAIARLNDAAIRTWPVSLPQVFLPDQYSETYGDRAIRFQPAEGPTLNHAAISKNYHVISGSFDMEKQQRIDFDTFYKSMIVNGMHTFEASLRGEATPGRYLFTKRPSYTDIENGCWQVNVSVIALP